jgi:hypothetical protein
MMKTGAVCTCGALMFGAAPDVHTFLATHPANGDHRVNAVLPDNSPQSDRIQRAYMKLLTESLAIGGRL